MVNSYVVQVGLVALLVLANALLAGSEVALISLREGQLSRLTERSPSGRVLAALARDPNRFLATVQIGITLSGFLASATREPGGVVVLPGGFPIHDLPSHGFAVEPPVGGVYTTVAGMVLAGLGHIPEAPGEVIRTPACTAEVVEVTGHAITRVRLSPPRS